MTSQGPPAHAWVMPYLDTHKTQPLTPPPQAQPSLMKSFRMLTTQRISSLHRSH